MRIAVIGTIMRDEIHTASGEVVESFGGILYNVVALAALTRGTDKVVPVCRIGKDHLAHITERYMGLSGHVPATCVHASPGGTDENLIRYGGGGDRAPGGAGRRWGCWHRLCETQCRCHPRNAAGACG